MSFSKSVGIYAMKSILGLIRRRIPHLHQQCQKLQRLKLAILSSPLLLLRKQSYAIFHLSPGEKSRAKLKIYSISFGSLDTFRFTAMSIPFK